MEDCYIEGKIEIEEDFDIKKFKVFYGQFDYKSIEATLITKITYDQKEVDWEIDSYEGTGINSFEFVIID